MCPYLSSIEIWHHIFLWLGCMYPPNQVKPSHLVTTCIKKQVWLMIFLHLEHYRAITPLRTSSMFSLKSRNKVIFQQVEQFTEFTYKSPWQHWSVFYNHQTLVLSDKNPKQTSIETVKITCHTALYNIYQLYKVELWLFNHSIYA